MSEPLRLGWLSLPDARERRELRWLADMPDANVALISNRPTGDPVPLVARRYRRPTRRFVEAGSLAWLRNLDTVPAEAAALEELGGALQWVASLELFSLITGQSADLARRHKLRQAVLLWNNDVHHPLYRLPPYRDAFRRARHADLVLCLVEAAVDHCIGLGIPEERIAQVLPPIDTGHFVPAERPVDEPVIVFCSPVAPNKGMDRVLDAFALVRQRIPDARLLVAGGGPLAGAVQEAERITNGAVRYLGPQNRDGVRDAMQQGAVFTTAPRPTRVWNEQFGLAYVEAMACGLPVVTTACGSNHEAVTPPNLRVRDDAREIADALCTFLDSASLRQRVGQRNRSWVIERFEYHQQVAKLRAAFDAAV